MQNRKVFDRYLTVSEERQLMRFIAQFNTIIARRDHAWMLFARQSGVRLSVLAGVTVLDAMSAIKTKYLTVRGEINKGNKTYKLYATQRCRAALRLLLKIRREMGYADDPDAPLIMSRKHCGMTERAFQKQMQKYVKESGLNVNASPHWWRHTFAKRIMKQSTADDPLVIVSSALGHADVKNTVVYSFPDREEYEQAMEEAS